MSTSNELREEFAKNFSYEQLTECDIVRLGMFCMAECAEHSLYANHTKIWIPSLLPKHGVKVEMSDSGGIKCAFIRCNGTYFKGREAISFNSDGYIGFAGWADLKNLKPFHRAFKRWMDEMRLGSDRVRSESPHPSPLAQVFAPAC